MKENERCLFEIPRGVIEMLNILRCLPVLLVSLLTLCVVPGCAPREDVSEGVVSEQPGFRRLISPELLEHAKLKIQWEHKLPIKGPERLERLLIRGNRIYALSDHNYVVSLNRETGHVIFSQPLASPGLTILGLEPYGDELIALIGNRLAEISADFGTELRSEGLDFGVTCPAARNSSHFYLAGADGRLRTLRAKDKVKLFEVAADRTITSIIADDKFVVFATDGGNVTALAPDRPQKFWEFSAGDGIIGPIVRDGESLFVASKDTYVYKLGVQDGTTPVWRYQTGAILDSHPRVTGGVVYQYVRYQGLSAIDKKSGSFMWQLPEGVDLLAEARGKAYVVTNMGTLVVMDNKEASRLTSIYLAGASKYAANVTDSKIYIADEAGRIACLKPVE
jgi:outer membrane protein assembly factor BamB